MAPGQRSYFHNPYERRSDASHASIFLIALVLLLGVAAILFYGSGSAIPADPATLIPTDLPAALTNQSAAPAPAAPTAAPGAASQGVPPTAVPQPSPTAQPAGLGEGVVANAPNGLFISRTPSREDRLIAWPNGTLLKLLGEETSAQGLAWVKVRDPRGNEGWVPKQNVQALSQ